jgi:hypothetical protein
MKKIIAFAVGTVVLVGGAISVQAFATTSRGDDKRPPGISQTESPDGATTQDDGQRGGYTEDHSGKPGETK